jgi:hypothetical protein
VPRRLLVVATASVPATALRESVRAHAGEDAETLVIAPASDISRLDWLTNADSDARTEPPSGPTSWPMRHRPTTSNPGSVTPIL